MSEWFLQKDKDIRTLVEDPIMSVKCVVVFESGAACEAKVLKNDVFFEDPDFEFNYDVTDIVKWRIGSLTDSWSSSQSSQVQELKEKIEKMEADIKWIKENYITKESLIKQLNQLKRITFSRRG